LIQLGIDEAGRGPVLGPLVMAGLVADEAGRRRLADLGVADSKSFGSGAKAQAQRAKLAEVLQQEFPHRLLFFSPSEIDQAVKHKGLNRLEQQGARQILQSLSWEQAVLDGQTLFRPLANACIKAVNKADRDFIVVAAASILAKNARDQALEELLAPFALEFGGGQGGGYPNPATLRFVQWHWQRFGSLPACYRTSYQWKAVNLT